MKKLLTLLLACCLAVCVATPTLAIEESQQEIPLEQPAGEPETEIVTVSTLDEFQAAIEAAEDGDTITLAKTIYIYGETVSTNKKITIVRANDFTSGVMIRMYAGTVGGLEFKESARGGIISASPKQGEVIIQNCTFDGGGMGIGVTISGALPDENITKIIGCEFSNCFDNSIKARK